MLKIAPVATGLALCAIASSGAWVLADSTLPHSHLALIAQASSPSQPSARGKTKRDDLFKQLNLTEQQKQQISAIRKKYQDPMRQSRDQLRVAQNELDQLLTGTGSESAIRDKHKTVSSLIQQLGDLRLDSMLEIRKVLTTEQRDQLSQLIKTNRDRWAQHRQGQGRPPGPPPDDF